MRRYTVELWDADGEPNRMPDLILSVTAKGKDRALKAAKIRGARIERDTDRQTGYEPRRVEWADWYIMEEPCAATS